MTGPSLVTGQELVSDVSAAEQPAAAEAAVRWTRAARRAAAAPRVLEVKSAAASDGLAAIRRAVVRIVVEVGGVR